MIEVKKLHKSFVQQGKGLLRRGNKKTILAVEDVSFTAPNGAITGVLGPNGAGKTTTMRMIAGLIKPDAGTIRVDGLDVVADPLPALKRMGVLSDAKGIYPRLTARENIIYYGRMHGMTADEANARAEELARVLDMQALLDRRTLGFSTGERMKTALARALVHDPDNIILDEPTNGLDVLATRALRNALQALRSPEGGAKCIIFSTHIMQEVYRLCDSVIVVARGKTLAHGSIKDILALGGQTADGDFEDAFVQLAFGHDALQGSNL
jgi:sodium transport system ATP-binding protein